MSLAMLIEAMMQAGASQEAILIAVRAVEERDAALEAKRTIERERKRRQRDRTVTGQSRDSHGDKDGTVTDNPPLSRPPNENISNPPTHTPPDHKTRARKGHRLPEDWVPAPLPAEVAAFVAKWQPGALERELARFRDWGASASGQVALKTDWDAAWRNWLRKAESDGRNKGNGHAIRTHGTSLREIAEAVAARQ